MRSRTRMLYNHQLCNVKTCRIVALLVNGHGRDHLRQSLVAELRWMLSCDIGVRARYESILAKPGQTCGITEHEGVSFDASCSDVDSSPPFQAASSSIGWSCCSSRCSLSEVALAAERRRRTTPASSSKSGAAAASPRAAFKSRGNRHRRQRRALHRRYDGAHPGVRRRRQYFRGLARRRPTTIGRPTGLIGRSRRQHTGRRHALLPRAHLLAAGRAAYGKSAGRTGMGPASSAS